MTVHHHTSKTSAVVVSTWRTTALYTDVAPADAPAVRYEDRPGVTAQAFLPQHVHAFWAYETWQLTTVDQDPPEPRWVLHSVQIYGPVITKAGRPHKRNTACEAWATDAIYEDAPAWLQEWAWANAPRAAEPSTAAEASR